MNPLFENPMLLFQLSFAVGLGAALAWLCVTVPASVLLMATFKLCEKLGLWTLLIAALVGGELAAVEPVDARLSADVPREIREFYRNPDGSCVQCTNGMMGIDQNVPAFATLLWESSYGPAERGGSGPERVAAYAKKRGVKVYNYTGKPAYDLLKWAVTNGRGAALTCGAAHMQYCMGYNQQADEWYVCDNNSPQKIDTYKTSMLHQLCDLSGPWVVALDAPPHPARGVYRRWWESPRPRVAADWVSNDVGGELKPQSIQFYPRELPKVLPPLEVDVREIRRRGNMEQIIGDPITSHPALDRFGEVMASPKNDADKWHVWCLLDSQGQRSKRLLAAWATDRDLRSFAIPGDPVTSWAHFATYYTDDGSQSWRWEKLQTTATPCVFVQPPISRKYGDPATIVFQATYADNPGELAQSMREAIINYLATIPMPFTPAIAQPDRGDCGPNCPPFKPPNRPNPDNPAPLDDQRPFLPLIPPPQFPGFSVWGWFGSWFWHILWTMMGLFCVFMFVVGFVCLVIVGIVWWRRRPRVPTPAAPQPTPPPSQAVTP